MKIIWFKSFSEWLGEIFTNSNLVKYLQLVLFKNHVSFLTFRFLVLCLTGGLMYLNN